MDAKLYIHLPGLQIDEQEIPFAGGMLTRLQLEEWKNLDPSFPLISLEYETTAPVFWIWNLQIRKEADNEEIERTKNDAVYCIHTAFLLDVWAPLMPTPQLSCCYLLIYPPPEMADVLEPTVIRFIGPMEREFVVFGSPLKFHYTKTDLNSVEDNFRSIQNFRKAAWNGEASAGLEVLEETARPDSWYGGDRVISQMHGFIRCMAAAENILLPPKQQRDKKAQITQLFGRQAGTLLAARFKDRDEAVKYFSDLHRFRSDLMHGRSMPNSEDASVFAKLVEGRKLLRSVLVAAIVLEIIIQNHEPVWKLLKKTWNGTTTNDDFGAEFWKELTHD